VVFVVFAFFIERSASAPVIRTVVCAFAKTPVEMLFRAAALAVSLSYSIS